MNTLIVVDMQNDFINIDGKLPVKGAFEALFNIYALIESNEIDKVIFTADWHVPSHESFKLNGGQWPEHCVQFSEGAEGSDTMWDLIGRAYGLKTAIHYYHNRITPIGNTPITEEQYWRGVRAVNKAQKTLMRFGYDKYLSLLARNWMQVESSTAVFAIADGFIKTPKGEEVVNGGTGWAVQMAIDAGKPCFVFIQQSDKWMSYHTIMNK
jgi:hypothetical protein